MKQVDVKIVNTGSEVEFVMQCKRLLDDGYRISSTSCGFIQSEKYNFCDCYQAILIKEVD